MALGKRLINTGAAAVCNTESVQAFGADAAFSSNIALYQLDGDGGVTNNVPDTTGNYNGVASGVTYTTGQFGNAASFDGTDNILLPTGSPFNDSNTIKAISGWVKRSGSGEIRLFSISDTGFNFIGLSILSTGLYFIARRGSSANQMKAQSLQSIDNNWHHVALVYDASGIKWYLDGQEQTVTYITTGTATNSSWISYPSYSGTPKSYIGKSRQNGPSYSDGLIEQVRLFNKSISPEEVELLYNETTSTASNTNPLSDGSGVALYSLDYDGSDAGGQHDGTPDSAVEFGVEGQINYGARFSSNTTGIVSTSLRLNSTAHSISLWVKPAEVVSGRWNTIFMSNFLGYPSGFLGKRFDQSTSFHYRTDSGTELYFTLASADTWYHIVITRDSGGVDIYVDGSFVTSNSDSMGTYSSSFYEKASIGSNSVYPAEYFKGSIDQVRIFSKALSSSEVSTLYAETACVHTSTTDIVNYPTGTTPIAYYKLDNSSEDFSTGSYDGTDTNVEYRFGRFGQAADFNGSSSKITLPTGSPFNDSNTIKAVSAWVKADTSTSRVWPLSISSTSNANYFWYIGYMGDLNKIYIAVRNGSSSNESIAYASTTTDTNWHHIFVQITATGKEIYLDGVKQPVIYSNTGSATNTSWISYPSYSGTVQGAIGVLRLSSPQYSNGFVDQIRIYDAALTDSQVTELYNEKPEVDTSNFKAVLYEGNNSTQYISNVGFESDLVWIKKRSGGTARDNMLYDSIRGAGNRLRSNQNYAASDATDELTSFDANGFTSGSSDSTNGNNYPYVAWVWKGGGDAVSNTDGSITSQVSANTAAGFSIVKYTGSGAAGMTVGHGLTGAIPELVIIKNLDNSTNWQVFGGSLFTRMQLDQTGGDDGNLGLTITSTTIQTTQTSGQEANSAWNATDDYIAYCFHSVSGYSKIGSYEGTNSTVSVTTGFKPSFVMIKNADDTADWVMLDNRRNTINDRLNNWLRANTSGQETGAVSTAYITVSDTGFVVANTTSLGTNSNGDTYIYMAFK